MKLVSTNAETQERNTELLRDIASERPVEIIVWYRTEDDQVHTRMSALKDRTKSVGAMFACAMEIWGAE